MFILVDMNETKSKTITMNQVDLILLLTQCEELLGYVAEKTDGVETATERRGAKKLRKRTNREFHVAISRHLLQELRRTLEDQA